MLVVVALLTTTAFLWIFRTGIAEENAINLLKLNISDVREGIIDASDENFLKLTRQIASDLNEADAITSEFLAKLTAQYDVTEEPPAVIFTFIDNGVPYDPLAKEDPYVTLSADDRDIGELGIYMVKKTMDEISYEYKDGQNILTIKKKI